MPDLILLPAVDVADGAAVRLVQGEAGSETSYGDPLAAAMEWQSAGAQWIHLVDLDAAFGRGSNRELLADITGKLDVKVELSGGIRDGVPQPLPNLVIASRSDLMCVAPPLLRAGGRKKVVTFGKSLIG